MTAERKFAIQEGFPTHPVAESVAWAAHDAELLAIHDDLAKASFRSLPHDRSECPSCTPEQEGR